MFETTLAEIIGSFGVFLLLTAFYMNLTGKIEAGSLAFACFNFFGATLACYAAYLVDFMPFVALQGTWAAVAVFRIGQLVWQGRFTAPH
jgi:hypothetical protein